VYILDSQRKVDERKEEKVEMKAVSFAVALLTTAFVAVAEPSFVSARPVWPTGRERRMNDFVAFKATFDITDGDRPVLRVTGCSVYRVWLNGCFAGYGPARAAKGFFRVDEWPLAARSGENSLVIEVSAYNCNNYCVPDHAAFLQAEVVAKGRVLAATGRDFSAHETPRVSKCSRYSFQRAFGEAYRLSREFKGAELPLSIQPDVALLSRGIPYPDFSVSPDATFVASTDVGRIAPSAIRTARWVDCAPSWFKCYAPKDLEVNVWKELQGVETRLGEPAQSDCLAAGHGVLYDIGRVASGFPILEVECRKAGVLYLAFDEILTNGMVNPLRDVCNAVRYDMEPGRYRIETFEPYSLKYIHVFALDGEFSVSCPRVRAYRSPSADDAVLSSSDPALDKIFAAARATFSQNAVDVFTDCPGRERAGWLCDSFFIGRVAALLTGSTDIERLFFQNYLLPETYEGIPDGMLPMCYPADHPGGGFIPNWAMWFVVELDEYLNRSGDRAMVEALKPRLLKLAEFLEHYENGDGLLENLPGWVFVEWSHANMLTKDVNYPSNMLWSRMLDCMGHLYDRPDFTDKARRVRETIRRQSWTGRWFCDNAVRQMDGTLKLSGEFTETCQYYAFFFGIATPESHPGLWASLVADFGPNRVAHEKHPEVWPSNAFIGYYLRIECLSMAGLSAKILDEMRGFFLGMAEQTGTLWEHAGADASCNHGFASHVAVACCRDVAGLRKIDRVNKTVVFSPPKDLPLERISVDLPLGGGNVLHAGWRNVGGHFVEEVSLPPGWRRLPDEKPDFCRNWKFRREGGEWQTVEIPHDDAIRHDFDPVRYDSGCGALPYHGRAVYERVLDVAEDEARRLASGDESWRLEFDGVMSGARVEVNGKELCHRPFGYASFTVPLDGAIESGENVIRVRIESQKNSSRWYPGFGIYREVRLVKRPSDHVVPGSVAIWTECVRPEKATVCAEWEMTKGGRKSHRFDIVSPRLWSPETPNLYTVELGGERFRFGIRTFRFDTENGFFLNGVHRQMRGVCLHHDLGVFGAEFEPDAARRQLSLLKEMGCDAIRTSHNPPAPRLLDLCDEMGFMVMDEAFDEWRTPKVEHGIAEMWDEWHAREIVDFVRRDRNHPCVVMWSAGNELMEDGQDHLVKLGAATASHLVSLFHANDPECRPVTAGHWMPQTITNGIGHATDVFGANYLPHRYAEFKGKQGIVGTETCSTVSSRGVYAFPIEDKRCVTNQVPSWDMCPMHPNDYVPDVEFAAQDENQHVYGEFVWTGFDYLGEPDPWRGSARSSYFGIFDLCGFPKDRYWLYKSHWRPDIPLAHILPHWNWTLGQNIPVHVYSSGDAAELFVNGVSQGRKIRQRGEYRFKWDSVPFVPGEVRVKTWKDGVPWAEDRRLTAGAFHHFEWTDTRWSEKFIFREVRSVDMKGCVVPDAALMVEVPTPAGYDVFGTCNGDASDLRSLRSKEIKTFSGMALVVYKRAEERKGL
jgi:alpha-L-rhamnosidase